MPSVPFEEEQELVARAQAGDERAFEALVRDHADRLYAVVLRFLGSAQEAEDVTQEAFLRAWRGIARFNGDSRFFTWLYRIGINEAKRRGAAGVPQATSLDRGPDLEGSDLSLAPEASASESELQAVLGEAIRELKADQRAALILRDVEGLSTAEAAEVMGLGEAAFKSRLHRARRSCAVPSPTTCGRTDDRAPGLHARSLLDGSSSVCLSGSRTRARRGRADRAAHPRLPQVPPSPETLRQTVLALRELSTGAPSGLADAVIERLRAER